MQRILCTREQCKVLYAQVVALTQLRRQPQEQEPLQRLYQPLPQFQPRELSGFDRIDDILLNIAKCMPYCSAYIDARKRSQHDMVQKWMNGAHCCIISMIDYVMAVQRLETSKFKRLMTIKRYVACRRLKGLANIHRERACITWIGYGAALGLCHKLQPIYLQQTAMEFILNEKVKQNFNSYDISVQWAEFRFLWRAHVENVARAWVV